MAREVPNNNLFHSALGITATPVRVISSPSENRSQLTPIPVSVARRIFNGNNQFTSIPLGVASSSSSSAPRSSSSSASISSSVRNPQNRRVNPVTTRVIPGTRGTTVSFQENPLRPIPYATDPRPRGCIGALCNRVRSVFTRRPRGGKRRSLKKAKKTRRLKKIVRKS